MLEGYGYRRYRIGGLDYLLRRLTSINGYGRGLKTNATKKSRQGITARRLLKSNFLISYDLIPRDASVGSSIAAVVVSP